MKTTNCVYWQGDQPHCGFPEARYHENAERLVRAGMRVVVVEQTETPEQLRLRNEERRANKQSKVGILKEYACKMCHRDKRC
jgi:DNA mismatch repair protein MSH6